MGGDLPDCWLTCPSKAANLIVDKFMVCKVPLSSCFDRKVPLESRFSPQTLFDICRSENINLGLWIDLTNTDRYYDKTLVEQENCRYVKLQCRGHGETPSKKQTNEFITLVDNFINQNPLKHIAIHCTHGFNRTGFLIVSYLVEEMGLSLDIALDMFAKTRPPGIYKGDYLQELYKRYDDVDDTPPPPELPDWRIGKKEKLSRPSNSNRGFHSNSRASTSGDPLAYNWRQ